MSRTITYSETLLTTSCWCGIHFAIPDTLYRHMQKSQDNSCRCPLGHTMVFSSTLEDKLEAEREAAKRLRQQVEATRDLLAAEERSHTATKGHLTRVKKRVHHGVCPHCQRSFQDLRRHMRSKHKAELKADE